MRRPVIAGGYPGSPCRLSSGSGSGSGRCVAAGLGEVGDINFRPGQGVNVVAFGPFPGESRAEPAFAPEHQNAAHGRARIFFHHARLSRYHWMVSRMPWRGVWTGFQSSWLRSFVESMA